MSNQLRRRHLTRRSTVMIHEYPHPTLCVPNEAQSSYPGPLDQWSSWPLLRIAPATLLRLGRE